jgi:glycosyltransferase involved in cell wall biosynthesis
MSSRPIRVCLYSPADLNLVIGSSIWVQAVAETLHAGPRVHVTLPLRSLERRRLLTDALRRLPRVELVDPRRQRRWVPPSGLYSTEVLDLIEALHHEDPFDAIVLRSFSYCLAAIDRPALRDRLWSTYILEPERDIEDPAHVAQLTAIAGASRYVVVQSEEMRALFEAAIAAGRGKTIILPPAVPPPGSAGVPAGIAPPAPRLFYAGKFHPFYPVPRMIDFTEELRREHPGLEFHVIGDQIFRPAGSRAWGDQLERRLRTTKGVVWHGAVARDEVIRLLTRGGIALSLWDYRHGSTMNDLVVSTKLLDYCLAGVPVILNRTAAQETILGAEYPLFVRTPDEALPLIRSLLADPALYRAAAERCWAAAEAYSYPRAYQGLVPYLEDRPDPRLHLAARPKLPGSASRWGIFLASDAAWVPAAALRLLAQARRLDAGIHLVIGVRPAPGAGEPAPGSDPASRLRAGIPPELAHAVSFRTVDDPASWWRTIGTAIAVGDAGADALEIAAASGARIVRLDVAKLVPGLAAELVGGMA